MHKLIQQLSPMFSGCGNGKRDVKEWYQCHQLMVQKSHTSYDLVSGPCGVIQLWRLAPPGRNPSTFACKNKWVHNFALVCQISHRIRSFGYWFDWQITHLILNTKLIDKIPFEDLLQISIIHGLKWKY